MVGMMIYKGGCHCGVVQFEDEAPEEFDGKNWESHAHKLSHLSKET